MEKGGAPRTTNYSTWPGAAAGCRAAEAGDPEAGAFAAGIAVGLMNDLPTCAELINGIVGDARKLVRERLANIVD